MKPQPNKPDNKIHDNYELEPVKSVTTNDIKPMGPPTGQVDFLETVYDEPYKNDGHYNIVAKPCSCGRTSTESIDYSKNLPAEKTGKLKEVLENVLKDCQEKLDDVKYEMRKYSYNHQKTSATNIFKPKVKRKSKRKKK